MRILPENPVEALFAAEKAKEAAEKASPPSKMACLVRKHTDLIKKDSSPSTNEGKQSKLGGNVANVLMDLVKAAHNDENEIDAFQAASNQKKNLHRSRKEACMMLRVFVFGYIGNENAKTKEDKEQLFYESYGSKEMVNALQTFWTKLDNDGSGRVDIGEFRNFAADEIEKRLLGEAKEGEGKPKPEAGKEVLFPDCWAVGVDPSKDFQKFITKLVDKIAVAILGKKSSFVLDDMMRVIWPFAGQGECKLMCRWCKEFEKNAASSRVRTPPILDPDEFEGLCSAFKHFDEDGSGEVTLEELVTKGLIYADQVEQYRKEWDRNGDGSFDMNEFCEMMCPLGYRAYPQSKIGSAKDGTRLEFDGVIGGWRCETASKPQSREGKREKEAPKATDKVDRSFTSKSAAGMERSVTMDE